jgi:ABC-type taurine transport system ATPase subunit
LYLIAGIEFPDSGQILLDEREITGKPGNVGYMFQKDCFFPGDLKENVTLGCDIHGMDKKTSSRKPKKV